MRVGFTSETVILYQNNITGRTVLKGKIT